MTHATDDRPTLHVLDLTDEELLGIDGPLTEHVAPLPWASTRTPDETELAAEVGLRSLVTHGRITDAGGSLTLPDDASALLDLRHGPQTIAYADHSDAGTQETRILYIHPHAVLTESVNAAGVHRFSVGDLDPALADLGDWCVPVPGETSPDAPGLAAPDLPSELEGLRSVVCLDVVTLTGDDVDTRSLTLYRVADGSLVEGVETPDSLDLVPRTDADVPGLVRQVVLGPTMEA